MKCKIPEISWHNRDPVLSVDIQSQTVENNPNTYRLASAGTDSHVLIWYINLKSDDSDINLELAADLTRHQRAVNVVKWSPNGELLASGDDESVIFIWKQKTDADPPNVLDNTSEQDKETWLTLKILRGHMEDVYDLSWSPNSLFLVSGSVDNSAMIWDVHKGKSTAILSDHKGFVQGVAWDPNNQFVATLSTDRYLRIFDIQTKRVVQRINKASLNVPDDHPLHGQRMRLFHDDTLQTFFRRLCFTPDGKLLLTPAGVTDYEGCTKPLHTTYGFSRYTFRQPALVLPCPDQYTVAVSCCPLLFSLRPHKSEVNPPVVPLPYRMIFAVATRSSVYFYDTQQRQPFAIISNIHYTRLTDVTWSHDGRVVVVSSTDGFCSLITFEDEELGEVYKGMDEVFKTMQLSDLPQVGMKKSKKQKENDSQEPKSRKSSTDEMATKTKPVSSPLKTVLENIDENKTSKTDENKNLEVTSKIDENKNSEVTSKVNTTSTIPTLATTILKPLLGVDIILDKEILSSQEKFESPEKKSKPATPIMIRRHPRTPSNSHAGTTSAPNTPSTTKTTPSTSARINATPNPSLGFEGKNSPVSSLKKNIESPSSSSSQSKQSKAAKPIAIRRKPRAIIPIAPAAVNVPSVVEEAMDAWPTQIPPSPLKSTATKVENNNTTALISEISSTPDRTEDIRLVYEDTIEEEATKCKNSLDIKQKTDASAGVVEEKIEIDSPAVGYSKEMQINAKTPIQNKTPRRVELKTISTPKSKKKLL